MKRTIHTTISTLVAIVAICAVVVPTASAERTRPGSQDTKAHQCEMYKLAYDLAWRSAQEAKADNDWSGYITMSDYMDANLAAARRLGCSWTRYLPRVSQVQTTSGPVLAQPTLKLR